MSTPPIRTGAPAFNPATSLNAVLKCTFLSNAPRLSPTRKTIIPVSKNPSPRKRPTFSSFFMAKPPRNHRPAYQLTASREQRRDVLRLWRAALDEVAHVVVLRVPEV